MAKKERERALKFCQEKGKILVYLPPSLSVSLPPSVSPVIPSISSPFSLSLLLPSVLSVSSLILYDRDTEHKSPCWQRRNSVFLLRKKERREEREAEGETEIDC